MRTPTAAKSPVRQSAPKPVTAPAPTRPAPPSPRPVAAPAQTAAAAPRPPAPTLPDRPSPAVRHVWFVRGLGLLLMPGIFLAWPLVLPFVFGLIQLGTNMWVAHIVSYVFVLGLAVLALYRWAGVAASRMRFAFGPHAVEIARGVYLRTRVSVPYVAIHEIHVRQGRLLRRHGLSTIRFRYRGGLEGAPAWGEASLPGLRDPAAVVAFLQERINRAGASATSAAPSSPAAR